MSRAERFIRNLNAAFAEYFEENPEELRQELIEAGIDVDKIVSDGMKLVKKLQAEAKERMNNE